MWLVPTQENPSSMKNYRVLHAHLQNNHEADKVWADGQCKSSLVDSFKQNESNETFPFSPLTFSVAGNSSAKDYTIEMCDSFALSL